MNSTIKKFYEYLEKQKKVPCPPSEVGRPTVHFKIGKSSVLTDLRSKPGTGVVLWISYSQVPIYAKRYAENNDYFIDNNVRELKIIPDDLYLRMVMRERQKLPTYYVTEELEFAKKMKAAGLYYQSENALEVVN